MASEGGWPCSEPASADEIRSPEPLPEEWRQRSAAAAAAVAVS